MTKVIEEGIIVKEMLPYSFLIQQPDLAVAQYEAYENLGRKYARVDDGTDVVSLITSCLANIPTSQLGAKIVFKGAYFNGTGIVTIPESKSVTLQGEFKNDKGGARQTTVKLKGISAIDPTGEPILTIRNLQLEYSGEASPPTAFIDCRWFIPKLYNVRLQGQAGCYRVGLACQPTTNEGSPILDDVWIWHTCGEALYIGMDWVEVRNLKTYATNKDGAGRPIIQLGGTSPVTGYASPNIVGFVGGLLHCHNPTANPTFGLSAGCGMAYIDVLDFEGVTTTTAMINLVGELIVGSAGGGSHTKCLSGEWHAQYFRNLRLIGPKLASKIDLTNPASWTVGSPSGETMCYCYIPNLTTLGAGITTYDLYNKWTQSGWTKVQIRPVTTLPTGIIVKGAYDRDATTTNQVRIVIDNTTGGNFELTEDAIFWLKLC